MLGQAMTAAARGRIGWTAGGGIERLPCTVMTSGYVSLLSLLFPLIGLALLYLVIRLAVRHAIEDADRRRNRPS